MNNIKKQREELEFMKCEQCNFTFNAHKLATEIIRSGAESQHPVKCPHCEFIYTLEFEEIEEYENKNKNWDDMPFSING